MLSLRPLLTDQVLCLKSAFLGGDAGEVVDRRYRRAFGRSCSKLFGDQPSEVVDHYLLGIFGERRAVNERARGDAKKRSEGSFAGMSTARSAPYGYDCTNIAIKIAQNTKYAILNGSFSAISIRYLARYALFSWFE